MNRDSGGSGGRLGFVQGVFRASNGKTARYKMTIPKDMSPDKSYGVLFYLHGDGGGDYNWFYQKLMKVARKNHLIPVAIMSPTSNNNGPSWWWDADRNAQFLDELIKKRLLSKYNIDTSRMIFTGASGGPTFLSGPWLRHYASQYGGGAVLFCGGLVRSNLPVRMDENFKSNFDLFYYNGTADKLLGGALQAATFYKKMGLKVRGDYPRGVGHCGFTATMHTLMDRRVAKILSNQRIREQQRLALAAEQEARENAGRQAEGRSDEEASQGSDWNHPAGTSPVPSLTRGLASSPIFLSHE